jgi:hypothetical protein
MISEYRAKKYCADDISLIENYDKAINDSAIWDCHHRDEIRVLPSGMIAIRSVSELKENGRYYNCPANELIFLSHKEHWKLHAKYANGMQNKKHSDITKKKIGEKSKGRKARLGIYKVCSEFGEKFFAKYGMYRAQCKELYNKEKSYFYYYGKCSWEV